MAVKNKSGKLQWTAHRSGTQSSNRVKADKRKAARVTVEKERAAINRLFPKDRPWLLSKAERAARRHPVK